MLDSVHGHDAGRIVDAVVAARLGRGLCTDVLAPLLPFTAAGGSAGGSVTRVGSETEDPTVWPSTPTGAVRCPFRSARAPMGSSPM